MAETCLSWRYSTRPLLQGDSAISREFIPDMIIAVKLQPTTNNYDGCWQVKCACRRAAHTHSMFIGERVHTIYTRRHNLQLFKVPRSSNAAPSTRNCCADCGGGVIKCFVMNWELSPLCECVFFYQTPVTHLQPSEPRLYQREISACFNASAVVPKDVKSMKRSRLTTEPITSLRKSFESKDMTKMQTMIF